MAPPVVARTVVYAGLVTVHIRTYSTTYAPLNGAWDFNPNSYAPMEWHGFIQNGFVTGLWARIFDVNTGQTTLQIGDNTLAHEASATVIPSNWQSNTLGGWGAGKGNELSPVCFAYPMQPGTSHIYNVFTPNHGVSLPMNTPNTFFPEPAVGANMPAAAGQVMGSAIISVTHYYMLERGGVVTLQPVTLDLGINNQFGLTGGAVVYNNLSYATGGNPSDFTDRVQLLATNWASVATKYSLTFQNPPDGANIDDIMTQHGVHPQTNERGFIHVDKSVITVSGTVCNGFGIFIAPDFSAYQIIQIIPTDAPSQGWLANVGEYSAKLDPSNALWMKNANIHDTLFVSAAPVLRSLPIFPPIPLEPLFDADPVAHMMRGL